MEEKKKPKYNMAQCVGFMLAKAWKVRKSIPILQVVLAAIAVGENLTQLFLAPEILRRVENAVPLGELLGTIGLFVLGLLLLNGLGEYIGNYVRYNRVNLRTKINENVSEKACVTSYPNTLEPKVQKLKEKAYESVCSNDRATETIWHTLTQLLSDFCCFVLYLLLLQNLDWRLMLVVLATSFGGFFASRWVYVWAYGRWEEEVAYNRQLAYLRKKAESVSFAKEIRIFGLQDWLVSIRNSVWRLHLVYKARLEGICLLANAIEVLLSVARNGIAYIVLIRMALMEGMSAAEFLLYFSVVGGFTNWVTGILKQIIELKRECIDLSLLREYLDCPEPFRFEDGKPVPAADRWELRLDHVSYRYSDSNEDIIRDMDLTIHPGEKVAIVGLNGAGKTTLVKLLCGFLDPDQGRVLLNGQDIREFDRRKYYELFSAVFQEFSVLDVTVAENVAQTVENIDRDRVVDCLKKAGLTEMISALPDGLDTHVGRNVYLDGTLFSGGETQRLMLARALYKNGPILMLDEPTAALDPIAESDMYQKYSEMSAGKTSMFISHRLASTRFCDRILFLENGQITEEGTHEALLNLGGGYAKLFEVQSRYYREGKDF